MLKEGTLDLISSDGVSTITFGHPKGNGLPGELLTKFAELVEKCGRDGATKVIVIRSTGDGAFCGGASFDELRAVKNATEGKNFFMGFARLILALTRAPKFTVARVHGKIVGGGVGLVSACDYSIAVPEAHSKLSELALGIGPFVVGPCVSRRIGFSRFATMSIGTEWHSAEWGLAAGLYSELASTREDLDGKLKKLVTRLAGSSSEAMCELKKVLWEDTKDWENLLPTRAEISGRLVLKVDLTKN